MNLQEQLTQDMKDAMKSKNSLKLSVVRLLKAAIKNEEIAKMKELSGDELLQVVQREIKKRQESITEFRKAGREDAAVKEEEEMKILYSYLPKQATDEEIRSVVKEIVEAIPAGTKINAGMIMPKALEVLKGKSDGKRISVIAREFMDSEVGIRRSEV